MAFSVMSGADAMREFTPYHIHPRHLDGYFAPEGAEFRLIPNPDGSTNLEGKSWYRNSMWPSVYWRLWSDKILHDIHRGVFTHQNPRRKKIRVRRVNSLFRACQKKGIHPSDPDFFALRLRGRRGRTCGRRTL